MGLNSLLLSSGITVRLLVMGLNSLVDTWAKEILDFIWPTSSLEFDELNNLAHDSLVVVFDYVIRDFKKL